MAMGFDDVIREVLEALGDEEFQEALRRASWNNYRKVNEVLRRHPELVERARRVARVKRESVSRLRELVEQAMRAIEASGGRAYLAGTPEEAREIVGSIVGSGKVVVMSKSMAAEEVGLREYLESLGNEVWETDLGQLLVQLEGGRPMHTIAPAVHMTRERAARLVRERLGVEVSGESIEEIVAAARAFLREKFFRAHVGITGANAVAADTGGLVLVENEGNIRLVSAAPPVHVAIVPVDKVVPTLDDAFSVALVQAAFAGLYPPTYISVVHGPSSTGDIEQVRVRGAHGPRELHVVFLDNGRFAAAGHPF